MNAATKAIIGVAIIVIAGAAVYYGIFSFGADKMEEYGVQDLIEEQGYTVDSIPSFSIEEDRSICHISGVFVDDQGDRHSFDATFDVDTKELIGEMTITTA